jgi:flavin reductase (DIM6/NTAB) family NADH-FMN oxidoreductase RutF
MASKVNSEQFKQSMSILPTGVNIVTTIHNKKLFGFTASSFTSVSLSPPLILFCIDKQSSSFEAFVNSTNFAVSILSQEQVGISRHFSKHNPDKFIDISYNLGVYSYCPLISGAICHIECKRFNCHEGGDHIMVIGEVINTIINNNSEPLVYCLRKYRELKSL